MAVVVVGLATLAGTGCRRDPVGTAIAALDRGDNAKAERLLEAATQAPDADASVWANLGLARLRLGRPDNAIEDFRRAAEMDHDDARPLEFIATIQADRGQWKPALDTLHEAVRRDPKSPRLLTALAVAELNVLGPQAAHARLTEVLALAPNYSPAVFNLAIINRDILHNPTEAAVLFQKYLKLAPSDAHADDARAALGIAKPPTPSPTSSRVTPLPGKPAAGQPAPHPAPAVPPRNPQAAAVSFNNGVRLQTAGELDRALQEYSHALQDDPTMATAHYNIGLVYKAKNDWTSARAAFQHALEIAPDMADARFMLALAYRDMGDETKAAAELETVIHQQPKHAEAHLALGLLYRKNTAKLEAARRELARYLDLAPNGTSAKDVRSWLKRQK